RSNLINAVTYGIASSAFGLLAMTNGAFFKGLVQGGIKVRICNDLGRAHQRENDQKSQPDFTLINYPNSCMKGFDLSLSRREKLHADQGFHCGHHRGRLRFG
ncbi:MAG: hypothetical protein L6300_02520, partial [Syntrophaceae bacterium]|nr:hypothetical protein [Syntrophaceae bacterium]